MAYPQTRVTCISPTEENERGLMSVAELFSLLLASAPTYPPP